MRVAGQAAEPRAEREPDEERDAPARSASPSTSAPATIPLIPAMRPIARISTTAASPQRRAAGPVERQAMDFALPPEIEDIRLRTRAFVEPHVLPVEADRDS